MDFFKAGRSRNRRRSGRASSLDILSSLSPRALAEVAAQGVDVSKLLKKTGQARYKRSPPDQRTADGILFDSILEKDAYLIIRSLLPSNRYARQVDYVLQDGFRQGAKAIRAIKYRADFVIDGEHVIDLKGHKTEIFKMKHKLFQQRYGKPIILIFSLPQLREFLVGLGVQ